MTVTERIAGFLVIAAGDERLLTSHVCLYLALCAASAQGGGLEHFSISRRQMMRACKILGNATYHKCIRELTAWGYIRYQPSYHPVLGSLVELNQFSELLNG